MLRKVKMESRHKGQRQTLVEGEERVPSQGGQHTACGETWERHLTLAASPGDGRWLGQPTSAYVLLACV